MIQQTDSIQALTTLRDAINVCLERGPLVDATGMQGCSICRRRVVARGLCDAHYRRALRGLDMDAPIVKRWSAEEDERLRRWYSAPTVDDAQIAKRMGRTLNSISIRASRLGLGIRSRPHRAQVELNFDTPLNPSERRMRISMKTKQWIAANGHPKGMKGKTHTEKTRATISAKSKATWDDPTSKNRSPEASQKRSDLLVARLSRGEMRPKYSRARGGRREDLGGLYLRSSWEANYARLLNWLVSKGEVLSWEFEPKTFVFESIRRGTRAYTPDFRVVLPDGSVEWHEIKGWMDQKSRTRLKRMAKYYPAEHVVLRDEAFFRAISKGPLPDLIPGWERKEKPKTHVVATATPATYAPNRRPQEVLLPGQRGSK